VSHPDYAIRYEPLFTTLQAIDIRALIDQAEILRALACRRVSCGQGPGACRSSSSARRGGGLRGMRKLLDPWQMAAALDHHGGRQGTGRLPRRRGWCL
jgi:hypothetical protein